jgi:blue copper oxidase
MKKFIPISSTKIKKGTTVPFLFFLIAGTMGIAQNPLYIPDTLSGTSFSLTVQSGAKQFFGTNNTPTYGYNSNFLGPTIFLNKDDSVTLHVKNNLNQATTVHWHGLHVSPQNDGGPHQVIAPNTTWSPSFKVRNEASTFWYHPHGEGKTEIQITKGLAGLLIVRDNVEKTYTLPRRYKIDDFPIIVQTKAIDVLYQFATANHEDSIVMVNGTLDPFLQVPQQVVRLRILNASSDRTYNFGLSDNSNFYQIASDGGLLSQPFQTNRLRLSVGERAEILVNLSTYSVGTQLYLKSYASELPRGILGADSVGTATVVIGEGYYSNPLNGLDFNLLRLDVINPTANPVTTIPSSFAPKIPLPASSATVTRHIHFSGDTVMSGPEGNVDGPFRMNNKEFDMDSINVITYLNNTEIWKLTNETMVAHPFHIHDIEFFILDINGNSPPPGYAGLKDVVLVQPKDTVRFITKFTTFADPYVPYMYHCHLLHHEDDGMMGTFLVIDPATIGIQEKKKDDDAFIVYPNPAKDKIYFALNGQRRKGILRIYNTLGEIVYFGFVEGRSEVYTNSWPKGLYIAELQNGNEKQTQKVILD